MGPTNSQNLLSARAGATRVTIGIDSIETLRALSSARELQCPACGEGVVLHAGQIRAAHFAHMPGVACSLPQTEPETDEHRDGKLLIAKWLREQLPAAQVTVEAVIAETSQRADILVEMPPAQPSGEEGRPRRIALEYQCASLAGHEWERRHALYRSVGIEDLWILGGSRLQPLTPSQTGSSGKTLLRTTALERAMLQAGAPLLFLDGDGAHVTAGALLRFRPVPGVEAVNRLGTLSGRDLLSLAFPWALLAWSGAAAVPSPASPPPAAPPPEDALPTTGDWQLRQWLATRHHILEETLAPFFGVPLASQRVFACSPRLWQAAIYYRFVYRRKSERWWLDEVETWARAYIPIARGVAPRQLRGALAEYQDVLIAANMLSQPTGSSMASAAVTADLTTLPKPPDQDEVLRLARYRKTIRRD